MSKLGFLALCAVLAGFIAGCGSSTTGSSNSANTSSGAGSKQAHIAYLEYGLDDFTQSEINGAKAGSGGSVTVLNANFQPNLQLTQCQTAVSSGQYNAIIMAPVQSAAAIPCVAAAHAAHIPVVGADSPIGKNLLSLSPQVPGVVGAVTISPKSNANLLWQLTVTACHDLHPCNVMVEIASLYDPITSYELKYFEAQAKQTSNIKILGYWANNYDPNVTEKVMPDELVRHPNLNVLVAVQDESAAVEYSILKQHGLAGKVRILGNGGSRQGKAAVQTGQWYGLLGEYPYTAGEREGEMAKAAVNGQQITNPAVDYLTVGSPVLITKANVDKFTPQYGPAPTS